VISTNVQRLGIYLLLAFAAVSAGLSYWQVLDAQQLANRPDNPEVVAERLSSPRGTIYDATGQVVASTVVTDGLAHRTYTDSAFAHVVGYASVRFETTALERAWDDILSGRSDPNPIRDLVDDILDRPPQPHDLTLTIDRRLQDFAAGQLGSDVGAVVALDPRSGAILAIVSTPTFDATSIADPNAPADLLDQLAAQPNNVFVDRARQSRYTPGSIMKAVTAAAALDAGAITPQTTFPDQPREEVEGFVVQGFRITEHDLGGIQPALWPLSPALQVSSNIYFAHAALELGADAYLDHARRFGFCAPLRIGPASRPLAVAASYVTAEADGDCAPFSDDVELASAAFGQARVAATPMQMALVAATIANDGVRPDPYVVAEVRAHADGGTPSGAVLERFGGGGGSRVVSSETASHVRSAMVDAVEAELGAIFAGAGAVDLYGISGVQTAGKTGTAQRGEGQEPHSWFIGFAPGQGDATPAIAVAVLVEGGGSGSGRAAPIGGQVMAEWLRLQGGGN